MKGGMGGGMNGGMGGGPIPNGMGNMGRGDMGNGYGYNDGMEQEETEGMPSIAYMKKMKNELESMMNNVMSRRGGGGMGGRNGAGVGGPMRDGRDGGRFDPMGRGSMPMRGARRG